MNNLETQEDNAPNGSSSDTWLHIAMDETEQVSARIQKTFEERDAHFHLLMGMIPNATRRIITEIAQGQSAQDHCAVFHASRTFNQAFGAYLLVKKGMLTEATTLVRGTLEVVSQSIVFQRESEAAEAWLAGKRFSPRQVRERLGGEPNLRPIYKVLSDISHANPEARWAHSISIPKMGYAIHYGGSYRPRHAATLLALLTDIVILYLREFHSAYRGRLSLDAWPVLLDFYTSLNGDFRKWLAALPGDEESLLEGGIENWIVPPMPEPMVDEETLSKLRASLQKPDSSGQPTQ